jgi:hypothetical protein
VQEESKALVVHKDEQETSTALVVHTNSIDSSPRVTALATRAAFQIKVDFEHKKYKSAKKNEDEFKGILIETEDVSDFKHQIFNKLKRFVLGHYTMVNGNPEVTSLGAEEPDFDTYKDHIMMNNEKSKKSCKLSELVAIANCQEKKLQFTAVVYDYGPCTADVYKQILSKKGGAVDRAGAVHNEVLQEVAATLRQKFHGQWETKLAINWTIWAQFIVSKTATYTSENRDMYIESLETPPNSIIHLFYQPQTKIETQVAALENGVKVARSVIAGVVAFRIKFVFFLDF